MPRRIIPRAWVVVVVAAAYEIANVIAFPDLTIPVPAPTGVLTGVCEGTTPPSTPPEVEITWERNSFQVSVHCPPKLRTFFTSLASDPSPVPPSAPPTSSIAELATLGQGGRSVVVNLTSLTQERDGNQVVVDVEGCGCVALTSGVPNWAEGLTFAIRGSLRLPYHWWVSEGSEGRGLTALWMRVSGGVGVGEDDMEGVKGICESLPPTLENVDLSYTPMESLVLKEDCAPRSLQHMEATWAGLRKVSLCTPMLTTLYVDNNEIDGDMQWEECAGGLSGVRYLYANHNRLTSASSCSWPSLVGLEVRGNFLTHLDLTSCPPENMTSLIASRNYLLTAPSPLPATLLLLDLSHNNITALPALPRHIQKADFSHNQLVKIGSERFERARKLHHLNLAHNHLQEITDQDFYGLKKVHRLDLNHNKIHSVSPSSFLPFRHLRHLHLHHNHLIHLDARILHTLSAHSVHATLHHNPWACNCQMLAALTSLQACEDCKNKRAWALQCRERDHLQEVGSLLHTCLQAIQHTQGQLDESDEDISEEIRDAATEENSAGAVFGVPSLVVLIFLSVIVVCSYRVYKKHKRFIVTSITPYCVCCDSCGGSPGVGSGNHNRQHQEASQLPTGELQDSDTETEM